MDPTENETAAAAAAEQAAAEAVVTVVPQAEGVHPVGNGDI